uniref:Integrase zinc-binding domain-containing protein n=1 Tax=Geospiza parvula TaxID=87175 RepID=A0A8U8BM86_GEOPR
GNRHRSTTPPGTPTTSLFLARWAHDASGHQGRDATYKWARDRGVDLTMDSISQVIHDCETCAAIKQAKRLKPLWYGGRWSKYKYGEAWQIDYITLPQTRQGKRYVLTMVGSHHWMAGNLPCASCHCP